MRIALLTCALFAAACGGPDNRPAQDPSSTTTTTNAPASTQSTTTAQASDALPAAAASNSYDGTVAPSAQTAVGAKPISTTPAAMPATTSPAARAANVANDPGAHDQTANADNTKINDRDRHGTLTPMNQGNSDDEIKITAAIRRGVMGDKSLSFTAKNVKIITVGTKVTLRGPVNSDAEKAAIETRAKQTAGVTDVDDQIEVKK